MSIQVRLRSGAVDFFHDSNCQHCGVHTNQTHGPCPGCGSYRGKVIRKVHLTYRVAVDARGTLVVTTSRGKQVGFYPAGSWSSWRAL